MEREEEFLRRGVQGSKIKFVDIILGRLWIIELNFVRRSWKVCVKVFVGFGNIEVVGDYIQWCGGGKF